MKERVELDLHLRRDPETRQEFLEPPLAGELLRSNPIYNKGTAYTEEERAAFGLRGLLPPRVQTLEIQLQRVMENYRRKSSDLERFIQLNSLRERNQTLFYRLLVDRFEELLPIVYTPTVGEACQQFGRIYRRPQGLYLTLEDVPRIDEVLGNWPYRDVAVIVVTDGERILGLGDQGAGGMGISLGKLALYVAGAGIHPARTMPVCLDVGTDNAALLEDPLYLGTPRRRVRGPAYDELVETFVRGVQKRFPGAIIQFEDFAKDNASRLLEAYRGKARCFNDDIQGTGAVAAAGVLAALRAIGEKLEQQRVVIAGAGSAGLGIARMLKGAQTWILDSKGLLVTGRTNLSAEQRPYARAEPGGTFLEVVRRVRPTVLIGTSGQAGLFTREAVEAMDAPHPIILPLSNPTSKSECTAAQAREWTGGRAVVASGSPFPDTPQCNNVYIFPGVGLGTLASGASRVTDSMFNAAAQTLAGLASGSEIFPPLREIRRVSAEIAFAVGKAASSAGVAEPCDDTTLRDRIAAQVWEPRYLPYRPAARGR